MPEIEILGNLAAERLSIVSFVVRRRDTDGRVGPYLHHNFVVALLSDLFGIQSRGGCSCAGPYGHRLLGIDLERSHAFEREISGGCEGIKPGWVRINLNYFVSDTVVDYIVAAVAFVARHGWRLLPRLPLRSRRPASGGIVEAPWNHRCDSARSATTPRPGRCATPTTTNPSRKRDLAGYLAEADRIIAAADSPESTAGESIAELSEDFEHLRWFELPAACLRR